jgi:hypothetical protein
MFPFGFGSHLSFYLVVYVLTLVVHVFLIAYVLAGSLWLSWATLFPGNDLIPRTKQPLARILRDWMPFALSGAITAGVAPLLFVQILYRQQFYSANLILGLRWMIVIPVLVIAFYLLYIVKSKVVSQMSLPVRLGLSISIAACFLFVAFCWTANHLLSLNASVWPDAYGSGVAVKSRAALTLRLLTWITGTFPVMSILASWQLRGLRSRTAHWDSAISESDWQPFFDADHRRLGIVSIVGLLLASLSAVGYWTTLVPSVRSMLVGRMGMPWMHIVAAAALFQMVGWLIQFRRPCICSRWLTAITLAATVILIGVACLREIIRISQADLDQVISATKAAADVGGFELFLVFTILNVGLIAWCVRLVRSRGQKSALLTKK